MYSRWEEIGRALERCVEIAGERGFADLGAARAPSLRGYQGAGALLEHLHARAGSDPERDRLLAELVVAAKTSDGPGRLATALLWLAFWPALTSLLGRTIARSSDDADELAADLAEKFTIVIARCDPKVVTKMAATLLWNTRRRFWESVRVRCQVQAMEVPFTEEAERHLAVQPDAEIVDALNDLERELGDDAELVLGCMVEGFTTREAAAHRGVSREAIKKRLQRASARLHAGGMVRRWRRGVPDRSATSPIQGKGMKQHGMVADGQSNERDRDIPASSARTAHRGGRRTVVRGCGRDKRDDTLPTAVGSGPMEATSEPALRALVLSFAGAPGLGGLEHLVSYCDVCRCWGERGSDHVCGQNWSEHLLPLLAALSGRAPHGVR